ncbi:MULTISPECIES: hypothetical protein [Okeania]|uniref:hypothetical protein n=1 Tax=Okeania TaxID=1458928 RepID=UPI001374DD5B|nr:MULTISPECIES: hypothetical protein [Okeania]NEQ91727.1 hypothetical protein [Okeania sp. SIO2G4]NES78509.1 hypothetical protein [Okeania sp. SIO1H4]NET22039.1 hypothetical protein [Okeania sp. SIO1H5]NET78499.1 hypothetical protein [Okeania sp. SIO1F9]NET96138.1 hypothetical protein [Okeania sp. SIO1H2]
MCSNQNLRCVEEKYLLPLSVANVAIANSFSQAPKFEVYGGKSIKLLDHLN